MPYKDKAQQKLAQQNSYQRNRDKIAERSRKQRADNKAWLNTQKIAPCADCGNCFPPIVMDFHHRDPATKVGQVSSLILIAGRQRVLDEIAKCDLLCANCHRLRHATG